MKNLTKIQLAYAAGIMDGEGTITIVNSKCQTCRRDRRHRTAIMMSNTNLKVVKLFQSWFGGSLITLPHRELDRKQQYRWTLTSLDDELDFLYALQPYLIIKRKHAEIAIEFLLGAHKQWNQWTLTDAEFDRREKLHIKIKRLNQRGLLSEL